MVLSRAPFGVRRQRACRRAVSYLLLVGWEIILVSLSTKAVATVFERLGWSHGTPRKVVAFVIVVAVIVLAGIMGFDAIMTPADVAHRRPGRRHRRLHRADPERRALAHRQRAALRLGQGRPRRGSSWPRRRSGVGWVNAGADYSRYLPRSASCRGVVGLDDVRRERRAGHPDRLRDPAGRVQRQARPRDQRRPDRRPDHAAADLVPRAVRHRRRRWPDLRARCSTSTPPGSPCSPSACRSSAGRRPASTAC